MSTAVTVVAIHGSPGGPRSWDDVRAAVAETGSAAGTAIDFLTPTLPGHDGSGPVGNRHLDLVGRAATIPAIDGPTVLVGYSYGGVVATMAAADPPRRVDALVLLEPVLLTALPADAEPAMAGRAGLLRYRERAEAGDPAAIGLLVDLWYGAGTWDGMTDRLQAYLTAATPTNLEDLRAMLATPIDLGSVASRSIPTTVVIGTASPPPLPGICDAVVDAIPTASLGRIEGANHAMLETHPVEVAAVIARAVAAVVANPDRAD
ncbi:MAG: alpha/beta hydrolase [Actinomycetota bacterium]